LMDFLFFIALQINHKKIVKIHATR